MSDFFLTEDDVAVVAVRSTEELKQSMEGRGPSGLRRTDGRTASVCDGSCELLAAFEAGESLRCDSGVAAGQFGPIIGGNRRGGNK